MTKTKSNTITDSSWDIPFWFAVFSPVFGILARLSRPSLVLPLTTVGRPTAWRKKMVIFQGKKE